LEVEIPLLLFRQEEPNCPLKDPEEKEDNKPDFRESILCRQCGHHITDRDKACEVNGSHDHTFFNPSGIVFQIGCYTWAPGCSVHGSATKEFSWFAGSSWRLALCSGCTSHLGWFFSSTDNSFFGLIFSKLDRR
jgi:hypothetical protein